MIECETVGMIEGIEAREYGVQDVFMDWSIIRHGFMGEYRVDGVIYGRMRGWLS